MDETYLTGNRMNIISGTQQSHQALQETVEGNKSSRDNGANKIVAEETITQKLSSCRGNIDCQKKKEKKIPRRIRTAKE